MLTMTRTEAIPYASMKAGHELGLGDHPGVHGFARPRTQGRQLHPVHADRLADDLRDGPRGGEDPSGDRGGTSRDGAAARRGHGRGPLRLFDSAARPNSAQADFDGSPMVTDTMCDEDIFNLARVLRKRDEGFMEITQGTGDARHDLEFRRAAGREAQRPILWQAVLPARNNPEIHRRSLRWIERNRAKGRSIFGQGATLRSGFAFSLEDWNLYDTLPNGAMLTTGTKEEKLDKMQDPELRAAVIQANDNATPTSR